MDIVPLMVAVTLDALMDSEERQSSPHAKTHKTRRSGGAVMTQDQKDEIDETIAYVRGARDVLELHELRIRDFGDLKADPGDPYSIDAVDAADGIELARDNLTDTLDLLEALSKAPVAPSL